MRSQSVVYVLCGFIGSGKTTFAKKLEHQTGAVRITKDEWLIRLIGNDPTIDGYAELDHKVCGLSRDLAFDLVGKRIDVIIDEGFWERDQRDKIRERIRASGAKGVWYFLDTPIETIRERVAGRNSQPSASSFTISGEMLDHYLQYWQPPGEDEDFILVRENVIPAETAPGG